MKNEKSKGSTSKKRYGLYAFGVLIALAMVLSCAFIFSSDEEDVAATGEVAKIGDVEYATVAAAIAAAENNQTVVLISDVTEDVTIADKNLTLDLNGFVLSGTGAAPTIRVTSGSLTIVDSDSTKSHMGTVVDHLWTTTAGETQILGGIVTGGNNSGIFVDTAGSLTIAGGNIVGNRGYNNNRFGGGVYALGSLTITGGNIAYNVASGENYDPAGLVGFGGGVYALGNFSMSGGAIANNYAKSYGGGLFIAGETSSISGGTISGNLADTQAGGIQADSTTLSISGNASIMNNEATSGPGIYITNNSTVTISDNVEVRNNTILVISGSTLSISGGTIGYIADDVAISSYGTLNMTGGTIRDCTRPAYGAGVSMAAGTFNMSGGIITNCVSTGDSGGGAGVTVANGCTFNMSGTAVISNCTASRNGGAVYLGTTGTFNMSGGTITGCVSNPDSINKYGNGAGIYSGGILNITGGTITGCETTATNVGRAEDGGAAIYIRTGQASISGVNIHDNTVSNGCHGDAIYIRTEILTSITIDKANITGEIYFNGTSATPNIEAYVENNNIITGYDDIGDAFEAAATSGVVFPLIDVVLNDGESMTVNNMTVLENITITVNGTVTYNGTVTNGGTMVVGATGVLNGNGRFVNNGTVTNGGSIIINGSIVDNGTITNNGTITVTVTFNANSGTGSMDAQNVPYNTATALTANTFTKEGYRFVGWNTVADGSGTAYTDAQSVTLNAGLSLYAQWVMVYTIAFNANGGTGEAMANLDATAGVDIALTANAFSKDGYAFGGWATAADGKAIYSDKAVVKDLTTTAGATVTLYAVWIQIEKTENAAVVTVTTDAVSDQAADQLVSEAKKMKDAGTENVSVDVKATETESVSIKSDSVKDAVDSGIGVNIATSKGAMEFSSEALKGLIEDGKTLKSEIKEIEVPPAYAEKIPADAKVFSISLTSNDTAITKFGATFTVRVAYEASGNTDNLYVGYLADDGTIQKMESYYEDGFMVFTTDHLSDYAILEDSSSSGNNQGLLLAVLLIAAIVLPIIAGLIIYKKN